MRHLNFLAQLKIPEEMGGFENNLIQEFNKNLFIDRSFLYL